MELIKRIIKRIKRITNINENQSASDSDINELCKSEEEFNNINEIEDFKMEMKIIHTVKEKECILFQILKAKLK